MGRVVSKAKVISSIELICASSSSSLHKSDDRVHQLANLSVVAHTDAAGLNDRFMERVSVRGLKLSKGKSAQGKATICALGERGLSLNSFAAVFQNGDKIHNSCHIYTSRVLW